MIVSHKKHWQRHKPGRARGRSAKVVTGGPLFHRHQVGRMISATISIAAIADGARRRCSRRGNTAVALVGRRGRRRAGGRAVAVAVHGTIGRMVVAEAPVGGAAAAVSGNLAVRGAGGKGGQLAEMNRTRVATLLVLQVRR